MGGHRRATAVYDLTQKGTTDSLGLFNVDYNKVSAYSYFGKTDLPWEKEAPRSPDLYFFINPIPRIFTFGRFEE